MALKYVGPGNKWNARVRKSTLTGKDTRLTGVKYRTACTFVKTHTKKD